MNRPWELLVLDGAPPSARQFGDLVAGDVDGDGRDEIIVGGEGALLWYRPSTLEHGIIGTGHFHVGSALEDLDGDAIKEVVIGERNLDVPTETWMITWYKPQTDLSRPWRRHILDDHTAGGAHDLVFADLDGDGTRELVANAVYTPTPGLYAYKPAADITALWRKHAVQDGCFEEGLALADLDGDGRIEIVSGPNWYRCPSDGPFSGPWTQGAVVPAFREMCRVALIDITGHGRPDILMIESEYMDGRLSWFENCLVETPGAPWVEHVVDDNLIFGHSLAAWHDAVSGEVRVFVGEMAQGGFGAPPNRSARLLIYASPDHGRTWDREIIYRGAGTHQATVHDVDRDGALEILGKDCWDPRVHIWKQRPEGARPSALTRFQHRFLDRDKPYTGVEILATDVDGDGRPDVVCGAWWYRTPTWERRQIPGIYQVVNAHDIDGDGRPELIALKERPHESNWYGGLSSELCWLKPLDPLSGAWEEHPIGTGQGDWPHGTLIAPMLPGGRLALVTGYHSAGEKGDVPEIFAIPDDPRQQLWPKRVLMDIPYGEEFAACDIDGDGTLDIVAGAVWLDNQGDGTFRPHRIAEGFATARLGVADINGDGRPDVVLGEEVLDFQKRVTPLSRLAWFENPTDPRTSPWPMHVIDTVRCPHSVAVADLDGDGEPEIICGEHDPFWPYRSQCHLYVYKKADPHGRAWTRYSLDERFEHHDGTKVFDIAPGRPGIISHGWTDSRYVHLWEMQRTEA